MIRLVFAPALLLALLTPLTPLTARAEPPGPPALIFTHGCINRSDVKFIQAKAQEAFELSNMEAVDAVGDRAKEIATHEEPSPYFSSDSQNDKERADKYEREGRLILAMLSYVPRCK